MTVVQVNTINDIPEEHRDWPILESLNDIKYDQFIYRANYKGEIDVLKILEDILHVYVITEDIKTIIVDYTSHNEQLKRRTANIHIEVVKNKIEMVIDHGIDIPGISIVKHVHSFHKLLNTPEYIVEAITTMISNFGGALHDFIIFTDIDIGIDVNPYIPYEGKTLIKKVDNLDNRL